MSSFVAGIFGIIAMLLLVALRMPVGFAMIAVSGIGIGYIYSWNISPIIGAFGITPFASANSFMFTTIPMFVLMGSITYRSNIGAEMFDTARKWIGHWPGGLASATVGACAGFAAASGSSVATAAALGKITIPEMRKHGIHPRIATGTVAAGGTLGILIPPSLGMIIFAMMTDQSIGRLFMAGIVPGILMALLFVVAVMIWAYMKPQDAPRSERFGWAERFRSLTGLVGILSLFFLVMGGIYFGWFTPTEAASMGAFGAFVIAFFKGRLTWDIIAESLRETVETTCMIFTIIIGAHLISVFLATTQVPALMAAYLSDLPYPPLVVLLMILAIYVLLGCVLDTLAMIVLTVPIIFPTIIAMGYDPIWFGIMIIIVMEMALITPPIGMNVFVIKATTPDIPLPTIFAGIWPFLVVQVIMMGLLIAFPALALWLPGIMF